MSVTQEKYNSMTIEQQVDHMSAMAEQGMADGTYLSKCIYGEAVYYVENDKGLKPGHIYSKDGMAEYKISRCCEFHFDEMFKEDDN